MGARDLMAGVATMTSLELVDFINAERLVDATFQKPYVELAHRNFMAKVPTVLGEGCARFLAYPVNPQNGQTYPIYEFPKREACLMAMSYSYELQAKVFDRMTELDAAAVIVAPVHIPTAAEMFLQNAQIVVGIERNQAAQALELIRIESRIDQAAETHLLMSRPSASETISHIRDRIGKKYGIPSRIIDEVIRQSPYAPKPAGMVKNSDERAQGGSYAVYWIKDVSAVFARFVAECKRETTTQVTHPLIAGKFKLTGESK